jgi:hypothetical protein
VGISFDSVFADVKITLTEPAGTMVIQKEPG